MQHIVELVIALMLVHGYSPVDVTMTSYCPGSAGGLTRWTEVRPTPNETLACPVEWAHNSYYFNGYHWFCHDTLRDEVLDERPHTDHFLATCEASWNYGYQTPVRIWLQHEGTEPSGR